MTSAQEPQCSRRQCKFFQGMWDIGTPANPNMVPVCSAFPGGIPADIAYGDNPHTEPVKGDNGIQFEKEE